MPLMVKSLTLPMVLPLPSDDPFLTASPLTLNRALPEPFDDPSFTIPSLTLLRARPLSVYTLRAIHEPELRSRVSLATLQLIRQTADAVLRPNKP
jgi:hypothetical protein